MQITTSSDDLIIENLDGSVPDPDETAWWCFVVPPGTAR